MTSLTFCATAIFKDGGNMALHEGEMDSANMESKTQMHPTANASASRQTRRKVWQQTLRRMRQQLLRNTRRRLRRWRRRRWRRQRQRRQQMGRQTRHGTANATASATANSKGKCNSECEPSKDSFYALGIVCDDFVEAGKPHMIRVIFSVYYISKKWIGMKNKYNCIRIEE